MLSLRALRVERDEMQKDWLTFVGAYDLLRKRILASNEMDPPRHPLLHRWSGTAAVVGSLELSIHAIERTIAEYDELIRKVEAGEITNADPPERKLTLV